MGASTLNKIGCFLITSSTSSHNFCINSVLKLNALFSDGFQVFGFSKSLINNSYTLFWLGLICLIYELLLPSLLIFLCTSVRSSRTTSEKSLFSVLNTIAVGFHLISIFSPYADSLDYGLSNKLSCLTWFFFLSSTLFILLNSLLSCVLLSNSFFKSIEFIISVGIDGASGSKPPWI